MCFSTEISVSPGASSDPGFFFGKYTKMLLDKTQAVRKPASTAFFFELNNDIWPEVELITMPFPNFVCFCSLVTSMQ